VLSDGKRPTLNVQSQIQRSERCSFGDRLETGEPAVAPHGGGYGVAGISFTHSSIG
jgi:hypothetical protein